MIEQLNPDMTISEVANILEDHERDVWSWYLDPYTLAKWSPYKTTLRDISPLQSFIVTVIRGSNEGIYLWVRALTGLDKSETVLIGKTLEDPDSEHWDRCWLSAGRIARALHMWW